MSYFTTSCSGCFEGGDYMGLSHNYTYDKKAQCHIGSGCSECGYTGKRRIFFEDKRSCGCGKRGPHKNDCELHPENHGVEDYPKHDGGN